MSKTNQTPEIRFKGFTDAWEQRKLGELASFSRGNALSWSDISDNGQHECILYGNLYTDYGMIATDVKYKTNTMPNNPVFSQFGDVLIPGSDTTPTGLARATSIEKTGVLLGGDINIVRPNDGVDGSCLSLAINAQKSELIKLIKGITVRHIHNEDIKSVEVSLPSSISEQRKIVKAFKDLDNLITLHQRKLEKTQNFKRAMLEKMFPKNGESVPEIRFAGFTDAWEQRKLGELAEIGDIDHRMPPTVENGIPYLMTGDFCGVNELNFNGVKLISQDDYEQLSRKIKPEKGDILFARYASVGVVRYVDFTRDFLISYSCAIIKKSNKVNSKYLYHFLTSDYAQKQIELEINTGSQANIGIDSMKQQIIISMPRIEEQEKISTFLSNIDTIITLHQRKLKKLQNIKKSLLAKMFV